MLTRELHAGDRVEHRHHGGAPRASARREDKQPIVLAKIAAPVCRRLEAPPGPIGKPSRPHQQQQQQHCEADEANRRFRRHDNCSTGGNWCCWRHCLLMGVALRTGRLLISSTAAATGGDGRQSADRGHAKEKRCRRAEPSLTAVAASCCPYLDAMAGELPYRVGASAASRFASRLRITARSSRYLDLRYVAACDRPALCRPEVRYEYSYCSTVRYDTYHIRWIVINILEHTVELINMTDKTRHLLPRKRVVGMRYVIVMKASPGFGQRARISGNPRAVAGNRASRQHKAEPIDSSPSQICAATAESNSI